MNLWCKFAYVGFFAYLCSRKAAMGGYRVSGIGYRVSDIGYRVSGIGYREADIGYG
jgi:type IV secretory pathway TrbL component